MMVVGNYRFHRRAFAALKELTAEEQAQVLEKLASFVGVTAAQWPPADVKRLPGEPPVYLVRVNDSLRLFIQADEGQEPEVVDIARQETLKAFSQANGGAGN
jgi:hypothetical protein